MTPPTPIPTATRTVTPAVVSSPKSIDVSLTGACNLACKTCFYADEMVALSDLPTEAWLQFFAECGEAGVMRVTLSGGDVFMRPDLFEIIDAIIANRMRYCILTNGTFLSEKMLGKFEVGKRKQRLDYIQVSIDGLKSAHEKIRGVNTFEKSLAGLIRFKNAGFRTIVRVTINRHSLDSLTDLFDFLRAEVGMRQIGINSVFPHGSACHNDDEIGLRTIDRLKAMKLCVQYETQYPGTLSGSAGPLVDARRFRLMEQVAAAATSGPKNGGVLSACGAPFSKLAVLHDGTYTPCNIMPGMVIGRIGDTPLLDVWQQSLELSRLRKRPEISLDRFPECATCAFKPACTGGCPGVGESQTGSFYAPNPVDCYRLFRAELTAAGIPIPEWTNPHAYDAIDFAAAGSALNAMSAVSADTKPERHA